MHPGTAVVKASLSKSDAKRYPGRNLVEDSNIIIGVRADLNSSITASADASNSNAKAITSYLGDC